MTDEAPSTEPVPVPDGPFAWHKVLDHDVLPDGRFLMIARESDTGAANELYDLVVVAEGLPEHVRDATLPKFRPGGILIVHAGGRAGLFSAIIGGWVGGEMGSQPVIQEIRP